MATCRETATGMIHAHLNAGQIELLNWYCFDGHDQHDIARWLGVTQQTVAVRLEKIRQELRRMGIPAPHRLIYPTPTQPTRTISLVA